MIAHLLQSTIFAAAVALLALLLRKNAARVRHWVWFIASVKFLIPFSLLFSIGGLVPRHVATAAAQPRWMVTTREVVQPLTTATAAVVIPEQKNYLPAVALALWFAGFAAIAIWWLVRWQRVHALRKSAKPIAGDFPVPILTAPGIVEPGIVGILRPVLLLPEGIENRLNPDQLHAIFAHEFAHVRRRDNLTSAIHMAVQAIFWFHPLVWWIGMRLVEERERACDEEVLHCGIRPHVYAEGILEVCRLYVESPLACVSGVTGSDLKKRIEAIMRNRSALRMNLIRKISLAAVAIAAVALPITFGLFSITPIHAQSFEVTSVKINTSGSGASSFPALRNGHLKGTNTTMRQILQVAWGLSSLQIAGPSWLDSDHYDLDAKSPDGVPDTELKPMLQALLKERFNLEAHLDTREQPVYDLVVLKGGPKIKPYDPAHLLSQPARMPGAWGMMMALRSTMDQLAHGLAGPAGRPVIDKTALQGPYTYVLQYAQLGVASEPDSAPDIFGAVQQQLGLKLEPDKAPVPILVVDRASPVPTGN